MVFNLNRNLPFDFQSFQFELMGKKNFVDSFKKPGTKLHMQADCTVNYYFPHFIFCHLFVPLCLRARYIFDFNSFFIALSFC